MAITMWFLVFILLIKSAKIVRRLNRLLVVGLTGDLLVKCSY